MKKELEEFLEKVKTEIIEINGISELQKLYFKYLGRNSWLHFFLKKIQYLEYEQKIEIGQLANNVKKQLNDLYKFKKQKLENKELFSKLMNEKIDLTLPAYNLNFGNYHPLNLVVNEITQVFKELGYNIYYGSEIEEDEYNFRRLNLPIDHPARDMQDTFYFSNDLLLRTHCTNVTARILSDTNISNNDEVISVISVGNVYRRDDDDSTHLHQFMQLDGFLIAPNINFANLRWTLKYLCTRIFGKEIKVRIRPSFFPFTEPSIELDIVCVFCNQSRCSFCKYTGWVEILGAGMINPLVFSLCGKSDELIGFAFGLGVERIAMIKYKINDIRYFYINDIRFLSQFKNFD